MTLVLHALGVLVCVLAVLAAAYAVLATLVVRDRARARPRANQDRLGLGPAVILKPLHGDEPELGRNLDDALREAERHGASVVFGLQDDADPALKVVEAARRRRPRARSSVVVESAVHGVNRKISNLMNMMRAVDAPVLVLSDSDIGLPDGYLDAVIATLEAPGVGVATCPYYGRAGGGFWARTAAMGLSYHFLPNVVTGVALGMARPCMGSTIALRRSTLDAIGGLDAFKDVLADDYAIGAAVRGLGLRSRLVPILVSHCCSEATLREVFQHEVRWARTVRGVDPLGHAGSLLTHPLPLALAAAALLAPAPWPAALVLLALLARLRLMVEVDRWIGGPPGSWWLLPMRDILGFLVFAASFFGSSVEWRGARFHVTRDGDLRPVLDERA